MDLGITTDPTTLADEAVAYLATQIPGYEPNSGNLEVILIEAIAPLAAALTDAAGEVPLQVFVNFGTQLIGLPYKQAQFATVELTFESTTVAPVGGYLIPEGTYVNIGGFGFATIANATITVGTTTVKVKARAVRTGTEYNKLSGAVELVDSLNFIKSIATVGESVNGAVAETDAEYANRLATYLTLQAPRPITALDYANFVLSADLPVASGEGFIAVGRAVAKDGYQAGTVEFEATPASESNVLTEVTSFTGITEGTELSDSATGNVIPPGTTVESFNTGAKTITMTAKATASHAKEKIKAIGTYNNERTVTVWVTNAAGTGLSAEEREAIKKYISGGEVNGKLYPGFREINFIVNVEAPEQTTVDISYTAYMLPGYQRSTLEAEILAALSSYLSPATWGMPNTNQSNIPWLNNRTVHYNKLIGVIENVLGVDYVSDLKISSNKAVTPGTKDVTLVGPAPLPGLAFLKTPEGVKTTSGSKVVTGLPASEEKPGERMVGMYIVGKGIPTGSYIVKKESTTSVELNAAATETLTEQVTISNIIGTLIAEKY